MTRKKTSTVFAPVIASFFIISMFQSISLAEDFDEGYPVIVSLDINNGMEITESSIISGNIQNELEPISATLELIDSSGTRFFVDFTDDLTLTEINNDWKKWTFEIEINPTSIGFCSCISEVSVQEENGNTISHITSIFISPDPTTDFQFPPAVQIVIDYESQWSSQTQMLNFVAMDVDSVEPEFSYLIFQSTNLKCSSEFLATPTNSVNFIPSPNSQSVGLFSFEIDIRNLSDGWYDLIIFARNPTNQEFSYDCNSIMVDNTPPVVVIEGPSTISEGNGYAIFDGTSSFDETWGIQGLTYIWSVVNTDSISENDTVIVAGMDERTLSVNTMHAGNYEISLTVLDKAGNLGTSKNSLEIQNIPPLVKLTIDGLAIENNAHYILPRDAICIIDASGSTDTQNDASNLRYVWRVNNIPTYEGDSREFSWPDGVDDDFILTIEVIDDDSESSQISILIKDSSSDSDMPISIIVLILSTIFFSYSIVNMRKQTNDSDIPKWS